MTNETHDNIDRDEPNRNDADRSEPAQQTVPRPGGGMFADLINVGRGYCMGAADTVPGVSGGTVALILGHYERLISAISRVDRKFIGMLLKGDLKQALVYLDGRFVIALAMGLVAGVISLAGLMHWLLDHRYSETMAVFFGLVLASVWVVRRYVSTWSVAGVASCLSGAAVAVAITSLTGWEGSPSKPFLFVSASIAICAMILPGISGAFIMLLLGVYHPVTGMIKNAVKGDFTGDTLFQIAIFACGCGFGLLAFSRVLRWLLHHHQDLTMAALMGLMVGSLAKLWPLQVPTAETADLEPKYRAYQWVAISDWNGSLLVLFILAFVAAAVVILCDTVATRAAIHAEQSPD
ncbi:MAG: DUF368 domain-containing protein [Planctomycetota bacterium]